MLREYDVHLDAKGRVTLRGARHRYYKVSVNDDGSYLFEPRELIEPIGEEPSYVTEVQREVE